MKKAILILIMLCAFCFMIGAVSAEETDRVSKWTGWTFDKSEFQKLTEEWKQDVREKIHGLIFEKGKSFQERAEAQAYALGWDDRFDYVEKYGEIDYETGTITYDIPFWDLLFGGLQFRDRWFTTVDDYNAHMAVYMENYNNLVQPVPAEA